MTGTEQSAIDRLADKIDALRVDVTALSTRMDHPSTRDCVHNENIMELFRRISALEKTWAWVCGAAATIGLLLGLFGQRLIDALGGHVSPQK